MTKVAIVSTNPLTQTGITSVILNLLTNMDLNDVEVVAISSSKIDENVAKKISELKIPIIQLKRKRNSNIISYIRELTRILKAERVEVLHVHGNSATMWFEIFAGKCAGIKKRIAHAHSSSCLSKLVHNILKPLLIRDMSLGIACSDFARKFAFNDKKSRILNNGIDVDKFRYDEVTRVEYREELKLEDTFVIGHVGNYLPVKNHQFMCKIAEELNARGIKGYKMCFVGGLGAVSEIKEYVEKNDLSDNIMILGSRNDAAKLYQMFDILILPSLFEGFPMVLVEAQSSGLPCLISDKVTKTSDILGTSKFLPIDSPDSISTWVDAIYDVMKNENGDRRLAAEKVIENGFSSKLCAQSLKDIYIGNIRIQK